MPTPVEYLITAAASDAQVTITVNAAHAAITEVESWLDRGGALDSLVSQPLRLRESESLAVLPPKPGTGPGIFILPADFVEMISIFADSRPLGNVRWCSLAEFRSRRDTEGYSTRPLMTIVGNDLHAMPVPSTLEIHYHAAITPSLVSGANHVWTGHRSLYIDGVLAHVAYRRRAHALASMRFKTFSGAVRQANMRHGRESITGPGMLVGRPVNAPGS